MLTELRFDDESTRFNNNNNKNIALKISKIAIVTNKHIWHQFGLQQLIHPGFLTTNSAGKPLQRRWAHYN